MKKTKSEGIISEINSNVFFKEFTFSKNDFKELKTKQELEFADNVVWLDEIFFIYQIKDRKDDAQDANDKKWFENKIINKAVKQIKSTLGYISSYPEIFIENEKGHKLDITEAKNSKRIRKIIVYTPSESFPKDLRQKRFYKSSQVGLIHLFHSEDYYWICRYLLTPTEIDEYLEFRESLYLSNIKISDSLPEQYFLAHFLETIAVDHYDPSYINNLKHLSDENEDLNINFLMDYITNDLSLLKHKTEYYPIIREIAKLNRTEVHEFKVRLKKTVEKCDEVDLVLPYRFYVPRTDCGFIFIPLTSRNTIFWKNALENFTLAHKYEQKAKKCIGITVFRDDNIEKSFRMYFGYEERTWVYDEAIEAILNDNSPLRKVESKRIENRYKNSL